MTRIEIKAGEMTVRLTRSDLHKVTRTDLHKEILPSDKMLHDQSLKIVVVWSISLDRQELKTMDSTDKITSTSATVAHLLLEEEVAIVDAEDSFH